MHQAVLFHHVALLFLAAQHDLQGPFVDEGKLLGARGVGLGIGDRVLVQLQIQDLEGPVLVGRYDGK